MAGRTGVDPPLRNFKLLKMDIIKPNSSQPSIHDELHIYSGKYDPLGVSKSVRIQTELRQLFFVKIYAIPQTGYGAIPSYENQYKDLGYLEGTEGTVIYLDIKVPALHTLHYCVIGSSLIKEVPNKEISGSDSASISSTMELETLIANAGTSAIEFKNTTGKTFTYSKFGTGLYDIDASSAIFVQNKLFGHISLTLSTESSPTKTFNAFWYYVSTTKVRICITSYDSVTELFSVDNLDSFIDICLTIKIKP